MTNRRAILGSGLFAVPAVVAATAVAAPVALPANTAEWDRAMADFVDAGIARGNSAARFDRADETYCAALPPKPDLRMFPYIDRVSLLRTADLDELANKAREAGPPFAYSQLRAVDQIKEWREAEATANRATDYDAICDADEAASSALYDAEVTLAKTPAPHLAALLWKLEYFLDTSEGGAVTNWTASYVEHVKVDMRRLLGKGV